MSGTICTKVTVMCTQIYSCVFLSYRQHSVRGTFLARRPLRSGEAGGQPASDELLCSHCLAWPMCLMNRNQPAEIAAGQLPLFRWPWPAGSHGLKWCSREYFKHLCCLLQFESARKALAPGSLPFLFLTDTRYWKLRPSCCIVTWQGDRSRLVTRAECTSWESLTNYLGKPNT